MVVIVPQNKQNRANAFVDETLAVAGASRDGRRSTNSSPGDFVFVSGFDRTYGSSTRAHVLRQHFVQKRSQTHRSSKTGSKDSTKKNAARGPEEALPKLSPTDVYQAALFKFQIPIARTGLDNAAEFEPFNGVRTLGDKSEHWLIQHYLQTGRQLYNIQLSGRACPQHVYFFEVGHDEASVAVMKLYAALCIVARGGGLPFSMIRDLQARALRVLNERMSGLDTALTDATLSAIAGLVATLTEPGVGEDDVKHQLKVHASGLMRMISLRGGWKSLPKWLNCLLRWEDVHLYGEIAVGLDHLKKLEGLKTFQLEYTDHETTSTQPDQFPLPLATCFRELERVYGNAYNVAAAARRLCLEGHGSRKIFTIASLLQPGTNFYKLLSMRTTAGDHFTLAILLTMNFLIEDCASDPARLAERLSASASLTHYLHTAVGSAEAMFLAFLGVIDPDPALVDADELERIFRCLYVYNRLSWHVQLRIKSAFTELLWADLYGLDSIWEPQRMSDAVLEDLRRSTAPECTGAVKPNG